MTNEELVMLIKSGQDPEKNMERLYTQVKGFIHAMAWKYRNSGELEDLEQEGYLALYPAIDGYDPAAGTKFLTYAEYHIRQRMQRYLQINGSCLRLPVHCVEQIQKYKRFVNEYQLEHGCEPPAGAVARFLHVTLERVDDIRKNACLAKLGSLDSPVTGIDGGEDATLGELTASAENLEDEAIDRLEAEELQRVLWECVDHLEGRQPEIIRSRYQENMTLKGIGQAYGIKPEAVRQIEAKALRELRKPRNSKRLRPFLPEADRIYSMGLIGNGVERFNRTWTSSTERAALNL